MGIFNRDPEPGLEHDPDLDPVPLPESAHAEVTPFTGPPAKPREPDNPPRPGAFHPIFVPSRPPTDLGCVTAYRDILAVCASGGDPGTLLDKIRSRCADGIELSERLAAEAAIREAEDDAGD